MPTVLLIDDNHFILDSISRFLNAHDFTVIESADYEDARHQFDTHPIDVAVIDIALPRRAGERPNMGNSLGVELAVYFKSQQPQTGVVLF